MAKLDFNENTQPYLNEAGEFALLEGRDAGEQHIELKIQDHLYDVLSQYNADDIEAKIKKEVFTIVRNTDYLSSVDRVRVQRVNDERREGSYYVEAQLREADDISLTLSNL